MEPGSGARLVVKQDVMRDDALVFSAIVTIICMTTDGAVARLPAVIRRSIH
jgi:acyl-CoA thioester hydrolase